MGRGKPFKRSLEQLVKAGIAQKPIWFDIVKATKPPFEPVYRTKVPAISYPEDRLRNIYLQRNPNSRRIPINMKAHRISDRHIADRFVSIQTDFISERGMSEDDAYAEAERVLSGDLLFNDPKQTDILSGTLSDQDVQDETARLYLASVKDAQRDQAMHQALKNQAQGEE